MKLFLMVMIIFASTQRLSAEGLPGQEQEQEQEQAQETQQVCAAALLPLAISNEEIATQVYSALAGHFDSEGTPGSDISAFEILGKILNPVIESSAEFLRNRTFYATSFDNNDAVRAASQAFDQLAKSLEILQIDQSPKLERWWHRFHQRSQTPEATQDKIRRVRLAHYAATTASEGLDKNLSLLKDSLKTISEPRKR